MSSNFLTSYLPNSYFQIIGIALVGLIIYILYSVIIYPFYLGPLKNLPRPRNPIKYLYFLYTQRLKGDCEHILQLSLKYGPVVHLFGNVVLLNNLEYRKYWQTYKFKKSHLYSSFDVGGMPTLFSTIEKDYHSRVKKLILPAFSVKTLASVEKTVYDIGSQGLVNHIQTTIKSGQTDIFDLFHLFHCSTFDVITQLVFGTNFNTTSNEDQANYYLTALTGVQKMMFLRTMIPLYKLIPFPMEKMFKKIVIDNIKLREDNPSPDILQSLIDSQDPETGEKLSNDQIAVECMTLLFAGMDTTANTLTWTIYELLRNPDVYELVEKEILEEFPNFNEPIPVEKAKSKLKYLEAALLESMRIYPVAPGGLPRVVPEGGVTIAGHYLPTNTIILHPIYNQHQDPKNWKNPKIYDIQRWLGEDREKNKTQLMTFGAGPRSCIGRELAWNEMYLVLANLIRNFRMELVDKELTPSFKFIYKPEEKRMNVKISIRD